MVALTIGMATYNDFDGVYFTLQALRLYQDLTDTELLPTEVRIARQDGFDRVVVDLTGTGTDTERAAAYGLGAARAVIVAGGELVLCTCEAGGPVTGPVTNVLDAGRRLARAVPGPPGRPPPGWPVVEIGA